MKKLTFISFLLLVGFNGFGQNTLGIDFDSVLLGRPFFSYELIDIVPLSNDSNIYQSKPYPCFHQIHAPNGIDSIFTDTSGFLRDYIYFIPNSDSVRFIQSAVRTAADTYKDLFCYNNQPFRQAIWTVSGVYEMVGDSIKIYYMHGYGEEVIIGDPDSLTTEKLKIALLKSGKNRNQVIKREVYYAGVVKDGEMILKCLQPLTHYPKVNKIVFKKIALDIKKICSFNQKLK